PQASSYAWPKSRSACAAPPVTTRFCGVSLPTGPTRTASLAESPRKTAGSFCGVLPPGDAPPVSAGACAQSGAAAVRRRSNRAILRAITDLRPRSNPNVPDRLPGPIDSVLRRLEDPHRRHYVFGAHRRRAPLEQRGGEL